MKVVNVSGYWRLNLIICNNKQKWNKDKCRCECKKLIEKGMCDKIFILNPSNCECECDKSCDIGECKKLIEKGMCDKIFILNLSNCECECDKSCDIGEYLDYKNCKCRKK